MPGVNTAIFLAPSDSIQCFATPGNRCVLLNVLIFIDSIFPKIGTLLACIHCMRNERVWRLAAVLILVSASLIAGCGQRGLDLPGDAPSIQGGGIAATTPSSSASNVMSTSVFSKSSSNNHIHVGGVSILTSNQSANSNYKLRDAALERALRGLSVGPQ